VYEADASGGKRACKMNYKWCQAPFSGIRALLFYINARFKDVLIKRFIFTFYYKNVNKAFKNLLLFIR